MAMRNPKRKGQVVQPNGTSWDKLEYVGQVGQGEGGLQILVGQVGQGEGGLQIFVGQVGQGQGVCPLEPFHLSQIGLQGRGILSFGNQVSEFLLPFNRLYQACSGPGLREVPVDASQLSGSRKICISFGNLEDKNGKTES